MAVQAEEAGLLWFLEVKVFRSLILVAGVTEEHELTVVFPLWKVKVLRATCFVGAHRLVFTLEDGSQVPELCFYVFH